MTPSKEKYLKQRLNEIIQQKLSETPNQLTREEREKEFAKGNFVIISDPYSERYRVVFPADQELKENYDKIYKILQKEKVKILDKIVFGQNDDLSDLFSNLANFDPNNARENNNV